MKNSKQSLQVSDKKGPTFPQAATGSDLSEGLGHYEKCGSADGMYNRNETKQRPAKGSDRV